MSLPNSRDITLSPGTEIPSTLLNALQDMIVGGRHSEFEYMLGASIFEARSTIALPEFNADGDWQIDANNETIIADIGALFPVGTQINEITIYGTLASGNHEVDVSMLKWTIPGGVFSDIGGGSKSSPGVGVDFELTWDSGDAGWPFTIANTHKYQVHVTDGSGAGMSLIRAMKIRAQR
jgi:hypothetical protein